ncbi:serine/threonine-protein kinase [Streptomyces antimicrobicus]|uniref:Serine/threonine-protein kinase n=1 Tax=Streptomyces antimicrobicus TaxID=2883108 RepID=A0ABS8B5F4_9ACTN|nr:serine/threonine-protein kinase [Streptomyces antimicrobicus]MCB5179822.1 serine/threonine-protein kinase [Streptomyces antimicrobicus]
MTLRDGDPRTIGGYRLEDRLGAGGMGVVYRARSLSGRQVAVKVVRPELAEDTAFRQRFRREVAAARQVSGAFTAPVVDADPDADAPWLATLFVTGPSLAERVHEHGPLPVAEVWLLAAGLVEALRDIHRVGLVHRDLKPGNVLLAEDGPRVIDFGIARAVAGSGATALTGTGVVVGTPPFMAPEQFRRAEVGPAADVFALGSVLVHAATGHGPFDGDHAHAVGFQVVYEEPDLTGLASELRPLVVPCLAKDPADRPTVPDLMTVLAAGPPAAAASPASPSSPASTAPDPAPAPASASASASDATPASDPAVDVPGAPGAPGGVFGPPPTVTAAPSPLPDGTTAPPPGSGGPAPARDAGAAARRTSRIRLAVAVAVVVALGAGGFAAWQGLRDDDKGRRGSAAGSQGSGSGAIAPACGPDGALNSAGASALKPAMDYWSADYQAACPGTRPTYAPTGSGAGIQQFKEGSADFAVVDRTLTQPQAGAVAARCPGGKPVHLPLGVMPVAVVVNLPGVDSLTLDAPTLARVFRGHVTRWNHPEITATNPGRLLPDTAIQVVTPTDESATTLAFTQYLSKVSPTGWGTLPQSSLAAVGGGPAVTSALVAQAVKQTAGAVSFTRLGGEATGLTTVRLATGAPEPVAVGTESATAALATARISGTGADLAVDPDFTTKAAGAYPIVQLGYAVLCDRGNDGAGLARSRPFLASVVAGDAGGAGTKAADQVGYGALPPALARKVREALAALG